MNRAQKKIADLLLDTHPRLGQNGELKGVESIARPFEVSR